ncbi:MAG: PASTA domain-containing protein, partial [Candidatus Hydrogenedens sp.]|nr:PASTA domain-containing protein [Candidatus Hydrogenedens sp.]
MNNYKITCVQTYISLSSFILISFILVYPTAFSAVIPISTIENLQKIGKDPAYPLNGEYELIQDIDASDTVNWNSGKGFAPIGNSTSRFIGKFDGKNYVIRNLYISRGSEDNIALFGYVGSISEIHNVGLENVFILGRNNVGSLAGTNSGKITYCYATGGAEGAKNVGGLVGYNWGGTVTQCYSTAMELGTEYIGGLVGYNSGPISYCYSTGSSTASSSSSSSSGGLVGYNTDSVSYCYSTGSSTASSSSSSSSGGLVGYNVGSVSYCYSTGSSTASSSSYDYSYSGGLVGYNNGTISQCYSTGNVFGQSNIGGLIAYKCETCMVSQSYWDIQTSGQNTSAGGTGKTTAQMKQEATFVDWDFTNVWGIIKDVTYPYLIWQHIVPDVVGLSQSEAENEIESSGMNVGAIIEECSDTVPSGNVISQDPLSGQQVPPGTPVNL